MPVVYYIQYTLAWLLKIVLVFLSDLHHLVAIVYHAITPYTEKSLKCVYCYKEMKITVPVFTKQSEHNTICSDCLGMEMLEGLRF